MTPSSGFGYCQCDAGWTGTFCAHETSKSYFAVPAFPSLFPGERVYYDAYGDAHPLFAPHEVASIWLTLSPWDYEYLVAPSNRRNASKVSANMTFYNKKLGLLSKTIKLSLKGASSRDNMKKEWKIHTSIVDQTVFSLKSASEDLSMSRNILSMDYSRAMNLPFERSGFAQLFMNGQRHGFYIIAEEIEKPWIKAHFPPTQKKHSESLIKCHRAHLSPDQNVTANDGVYRVEIGAPDAAFAALRSLIKAINASTDASFLSSVTAQFDLDHYLRAMVIEWLISNPDSYSWRGNNWWLYQNLETGISHFIPYDQEESYGLGMYINITTWETMPAQSFFNCEDFRGVDCGEHPLSQRLYGIESTKQAVDSLASTFVDQIFGAPINKQRVLAYGRLIGEQLTYDPWYGVDKEGVQNSKTFASVQIPQLLSYIAARANAVGNNKQRK